ncbi:hypothetical protein Zmor_009364 [Zophobas morio]|uniref:Carboxylesterase type B domain-containing protein n=1 Tax=Zophobas morio TaxID=2755281 RepID=A0AA38MHX3_9CUCU|nr:hypothetical protein Zmor_009364 [Zophobas morio]
MSDLICIVEQGPIRGQIERDMDGDPFLSFLGIPYAKPPLGKLRFKPPQPAEKWQGIHDGTKEGNPCYSLQVDFRGKLPKFRLKGSENCLVLNVFTHQLFKSGTENLCPVMVFVHGGAFMTGSCSRTTFGPENLMTQDIVLVLMNYRLGALGFLSIDDSSLQATGNAGLKDQVLALKWVQKNIKQFCGDPSNVTLFGQSSGSASVHYLVLSPLTKGLFHKAIMQSGTATCPWARGSNNLVEIARSSGCNRKNKREILECLQKIKVKRLIKAQNKKFARISGPGAQAHFGPCVEVRNPSAVITQEPMVIINSGNYNHVPLMFGYTSLEGILNTWGTRCQVKKKLRDLLPYSFNYDKKSAKFRELNQKVVQFYFGNDKPDPRKKEIVAQLFTDVTFLRGIFQAVKGHVKTCQKPVYLYRMSIESELNAFKKIFKYESKGVCHGDDVCYIFKTEHTKYSAKSYEDRSIRRFVKLWTNFAKTGNPIPSNNDELLTTYWYPASEKYLYFLDIGEELIADVDPPDMNRLRFWEELSKGIKEKYSHTR